MVRGCRPGFVVLAALLMLIWIPSAGTAQAGPELPPEVTLPDELARVLRDYERGWAARDAEALAELFTEDGFALRPGAPPARGRAAIRAAYAYAGGPLTLRAWAYRMDGDVAYIIGGYGPGPDIPAVGKFVLTLERSGDRWLISADMDNGN